MHPYQQFYEPYGQYLPPRTNQSFVGHQEFGQNQLSSSSSSTITRQCQLINQRSTIISTDELTKILDQLFQEITQIRSEKKQLSKFQDIITALTRVRRPILASVAQHRFFSLVPKRLNEIFSQWNQHSPLENQQLGLFRQLVRLLKRLFSEINEIKEYPIWFTDSSLLSAVATCLTDFSNSDGSSTDQNQRLGKVFIRLFSLYNDYQYMLQYETNTDQDKLVAFIDPIAHCLTSDVYLNSFNRIRQGAALKSKNDKFILIHCPTFFTNYCGNGRPMNFIDSLSF